MGELRPDHNPKIRRGYDFKIKNTMCHVSYKVDYSFSRYGLNAFKNMLDPVTFTAVDNGRDDEKNELHKFAIINLADVAEAIECAAIFVVKLDGTKQIYQINQDYYFDEDLGRFVEDEPTIEHIKISQDFDDKAFAVFDADNNYDCYGLIVEISKNIWMSIME